jgi:hypothetical protein
MSSLQSVAPKLAALIPRLATDHEGGVVATVRALRRTLAAQGLDLHDLARAVTDPDERVVYVERPPDPPRRPSAPEPRDWRWTAAWCLDRADLLSDSEHGFVWQLATGRWRKPALTPKQAKWLAKIVERLSATETGGDW